MKQHQIILELIQNVDLDDTETLNEIDARVWCFITNNLYRNIHAIGRTYVDKYTRSRDALKSIRPNGWFFPTNEIGQNGFSFTGWKRGLVDSIIGKKLPTEELAELHAIIQAIAYERNS